MALKLTGVIFSDLGRASVFMALDWVQQALKQTLGYAPFPATLNLRPAGAEDTLAWRRVQSEAPRRELPTHAGACSAQVFAVEIAPPPHKAHDKVRGAVLLPAVDGYPQDKIEVVAPVRLKDRFGVNDGDRLTLEFEL
jgi:riboflavin kinase